MYRQASPVNKEGHTSQSKRGLSSLAAAGLILICSALLSGPVFGQPGAQGARQDFPQVQATSTATAQPGPELSDLRVQPLEAAAGEQLTITVNARNSTSEPHTYDVTVLVDDVPASTNTTELGAGQTKSVGFLLFLSKTGDRTIKVGDLTQPIIVNPAASTPAGGLQPTAATPAPAPTPTHSAPEESSPASPLPAVATLLVVIALGVGVAAWLDRSSV